ncbi:MAG: hypothetical protein KGY99_04655 [Phycisphaerae bacterium]|nr:hypothetical protein [Phycisphaerae bacterium]
MMRNHWITTVLAVLSVTAFAACAAADELQLEPCTIELVDGTEIDGKLAVQFEMDDHLIVYSPRLATVRSFLKKHVHAVTVDGKRQELSAKRELTDADRKLIGQVAWPDEPPAEGPKPAYTTETWKAPRELLVWGSPGKSGKFFDVGKWLQNGKPRTEAFTESGTYKRRHSTTSAFLTPETDMLVPVSEKRYEVRGRAHWRGGHYVIRHTTIENNVTYQHNLVGGFGNLWVHPDGSFNGGGGAGFRGVKHTFLRVGKVRPLGEPVEPAKLDGPTLGRKWELRKDDPKASMEIIGTAVSGDETHSVRGRLILSEGSTILFGPRCVFSVGKDATLELHSSSVFMMNGNCTYRPDVHAKGPILIGTPKRPIEHDVIIGLGFKDRHDALKSKHHGDDPKYGMSVRDLRIYSTNPKKARLVLQYHGRDGDGEKPVPKKDKHPKKHAIYQNLPRKISVMFRDSVVLNGVVFNDFMKGGIKLANPADRRKWKNVFYGERNAGTPDELFGR